MAKEVPTKLFIGNVPQDLKSSELRELCEAHGRVVECDVIKNYAFVHFASEAEAQEAKETLHGTACRDKTLRCEISRSSVRQKPGMGSKDGCYKCGGSGHWSKDCPSHSSSSGGRRGGGRRGGGGGDRRYPSERAYYDEYDQGYSRRGYEDRSYYDDYRQRSYSSRDYYYGQYRDRTPYQRPHPDYYSRSSGYYGYGDER